MPWRQFGIADANHEVGIRVAGRKDDSLVKAPEWCRGCLQPEDCGPEAAAEQLNLRKPRLAQKGVFGRSRKRMNPLTREFATLLVRPVYVLKRTVFVGDW